MSDFCHLHLHTHHSLLDSTINPKKLMPYLKARNMSACACTDHGTLSGTFEFWEYGKEFGIKPILGIEAYVVNSLDKEAPRYHLNLLAKNEAGFQELIRLSSRSYKEGMYRKPRMLKKWLYEAYNASQGIMCLTACIGGEVQSAILEAGHEEQVEIVNSYREIFGDDFYFELQDLMFDGQDVINERMLEMADELRVPVVWSNDAHFLEEKDWESRKFLNSILKKKPLSEIDYSEAYNDLWVKPPEIMKFTDAMAEIVDKVEVWDLNKPPVCPRYENSKDELIRLSKLGLKKRGKWNIEYKDRIDYELDIIIKKGYDGYYMIVFDFVRWAKRNNVLVGPGRGSGAGSLVAYCLGITNVDPIEHGLIFERFLNPFRESPPDFDIDFAKHGRQSVIDYVSDKYGKDNVSQITTHAYFCGKGMIHNSMKALGVDFQKTLKIAKKAPDDVIPWLREHKDVDANKCANLCEMIEGGIYFTGVHAAGLVISDKKITETTPCKTVKGETVTQYEKDTLEKCGLIKFDFLGLTTLSVIQETLGYINDNTKERWTLDDIPIDNKEVFRHLGFGGTMGIFQCESHGISNLFKNIKPTKFSEVVDIISLYRPGCLQSGMTDAYVKAKQTGKPNVIHPAISHITHNTQGALIYQEQIMKIFMDLAGYNLGQADLIRRAIGKKKIEEMAKHKNYFIKKASQIIKKDDAEKIWDSIVKFAEYSFALSHATAYAFLTMKTGWLKVFYPEYFWCAQLNSEIANPNQYKKYVNYLNKAGFTFVNADINKSDITYRPLSGRRLLTGLSAIKGVGGKLSQVILQERQNGKFEGYHNFRERMPIRSINTVGLNALVNAGCFDEFKDDCNIVELSKLSQKDYFKTFRQQLTLESESSSQGPTSEA